MNTKWMYWLTKARSGLIVALGGIFAVSSFHRDNDAFGYVIIVVTVVAAALAYLVVDRRNVGKLGE